MKRYVALLRGINVGGKNPVSMPLLKAVFEAAGFCDVSTYINSGNLLFSCTPQEILPLQQRCREIISDTFALEIPVAVLPAGDYAAALKHAPAWWDADPDSKQNAIFVISPADAATMVSEIGVHPAYEQIGYHGQVIFWSAPLKTFSRTRWSKVVASRAYRDITIRNANTAKKLLQLLAAP